MALKTAPTFVGARAADLGEEIAARAALAAVRIYLDGQGDGAVTRALGEALNLAGASSQSTGSALAYDPLTVTRGEPIYTTVGELRLGDDVTGGSLGIVTRVIGVNGDLIEYVLNRDGIESVRLDSVDTRWNVRPVEPPFPLTRDRLPVIGSTVSPF